jgi:hypothetical protein
MRKPLLRSFEPGHRCTAPVLTEEAKASSSRRHHRVEGRWTSRRPESQLDCLSASTPHAALQSGCGPAHRPVSPPPHQKNDVQIAWPTMELPPPGYVEKFRLSSVSPFALSLRALSRGSSLSAGHGPRTLQPASFASSVVSRNALGCRAGMRPRWTWTTRRRPNRPRARRRSP